MKKSGHNSQWLPILIFPYMHLLNLPLYTNLILCLLFSFSSLGFPCLPEHTEHGLDLESLWCPSLCLENLLPVDLTTFYATFSTPESLGLNVIFPVRTSQTVLCTVMPPYRSQATILTLSSAHLYSIISAITFYYVRQCPIDYVYSVFLCCNIPSKEQDIFSTFSSSNICLVYWLIS